MRSHGRGHGGDGYAYLRNANTEGIADIRFFFGNPADVPLAGDWDGDGCDTLSIYRPAEQRFYIVNVPDGSTIDWILGERLPPCGFGPLYPIDLPLDWKAYRGNAQ